MSFIGPHHAYHHKKHVHKKKPSSLVKFIDKSIYVVGILAVAANIPQLWTVWIEKNFSGVSVVSWAGFLIGSVFWFWYGLLHKEIPIVVINGFLILVQTGVVLGLLVRYT